MRKLQNKDLIFFTKEGTPICLYGLPLTDWGYCWDRGRNKWRCPVCSLVQYKDEECPYRIIATLFLFPEIVVFGKIFTRKEAVPRDLLRVRKKIISYLVI